MISVSPAKRLFLLSLVIINFIAFMGCSSDNPMSENGGPDPITITIGNASTVEGNSGTDTLQFTVTISSEPVSGSNVTVGWATADGSATIADNDYVAGNGTLTFTNGNPLTQQISVVVNCDVTAEADETFTVNLSNATNANISDAQGVGTINNDDAGITVIIADNSVVEGDAGTANLQFTVIISAAPATGSDITVDWATADGTATTADNDYTAGSGTLTFTNGNPLTQSIAVAVNGDTDVESDETVVVNLSNAVNAVISDAQAVGTITNDDSQVTGDLMVDPTSPGPENGLTWATAYHTIQAAVDASDIAGGGEIWVAANSYFSGSVDPTIPVVTMKPDVLLYGGFEGYNGGSGAMETERSQRDYDNNETILDGEYITDHVVFIQSAANTEIDGFTVTRGNADDDNGGGIYIVSPSVTVSNCYFTANNAKRGASIYINDVSPTVTNCEFFNNTAEFSGAGIWMYRSSPTITDCQFISCNAGQFGGALYIYDDSNPDSEPILLDCTFSCDSAFGNSGGAIYCRYASPSLTNCHLSNNRAQGGGGIHFQDCTPTLTNCVFNSNNGGIEGGGIYNYSASPTLTYCVFTSNQAGRGAGMYNYTSSSPTLTQCHFTANSSTSTNVNTGGGGMLNTQGSSPTLTACNFTGNTAAKQGGGMHNYSSSPNLIDCYFTDNNASDNGGGLHNDYYSSPILKNCHFSKNIASVGGGGVCNYRYSHPRMSNCLLMENQANNGGGMFNLDNADPILANCVFSGNFALIDGGALRNEDGSPQLINCILYGDSTIGSYAEVSNDVYSNPQFSYCDIESCGGSSAWVADIGTDNGGNIDSLPGFTNAAIYDFSLMAGSPCIDAGNNIDVYDLDNDADVTEQLPISTDYWDRARFVDDPATTDTGNGTAPIIDMGAFEF
ncbi:MAG: hypothetical protein GY841_18815 [FCB group bacterium]|nr:hypothetical protein [FCB group bacterium]